MLQDGRVGSEEGGALQLEVSDAMLSFQAIQFLTVHEKSFEE